MFNIQPGEARLVRFVLSYGFLLGMGRALCATAISGLFLSMFGAQAMPFVFIGTALVVPFTGLGYLRLQRRVSLMRLIAITILGLAAALLVLRGILAYSISPWAIFPAMIGYTILYVLITLAFWGVSGAIFDLRQAKRLFGLLGSGSEVADIVGGLLTIALAPLIGSLNLLWLAMLALLGAWLVQRRITQIHAETAPTSSTEAAEPAATVPALVQNQYVRLLIGLIVFSQLGYFFVENIFYDLSMAHFSGPEAFSGLVGGTIAATSIATILLQITVAGRIAHRYGIRVSQLILPAAVLIGALAVAISGSILGSVYAVFVIMLITRVAERALRFSIEESSIQIAYQPLTANQRSLAQTLVAGGVRPLTAGIAGILILVATRLLGFGGIELAYLLIGICGIWLTIAFLLGRSYPQALLRAMQQRRLSSATIDLQDPASNAILERSLQSPHAGEALYALSLLADRDNQQISSTLASLLTHPDLRVRQAALSQIKQRRIRDLGAAIAEQYPHEPVAALRGQALETLAALQDPATRMLAEAALQTNEAETQISAIVALAQIGDQSQFQIWLADQSAAPLAEQRIHAARALAATADARWAAWLPDLLADTDSRVRQAALAALAAINQPGYWPKAIDSLLDSETNEAAAAALLAGGETAQQALAQAFDHPNSPPALRLAIARLCGRTPRLATIILSALDTPYLALRDVVIHALTRTTYHASAEIEPRIRQQLHAEARQAHWYREAKQNLDQTAAMGLLQEALDRGIEHHRRRILQLLAMIYDPDTIGQIRTTLGSPSNEQRAYAIETLDVLLASELRATIVPLFESGSTKRPASTLPKQRTTEEWLADLADSTNTELLPWIRLCAETIVQSPHANGISGEANLTLIERVQLVQKIPLFAAIPAEDIAIIAQAMQMVQYAAGEGIIQKGDPGESAYIIVQGAVRVYDGETTLNTLRVHDLFGETAVLDAQPRLASVSAIEACTLLRLDSATLHGLIRSHATLANSIIRVLIRYVRETMQAIHTRDALG
jgi:ATP:ADP antiporter, AAA family